ncbi:MAG: hypothetical protein QM619_13365 [Micropruina sp.]|uniref:hypothetical protein n=1 Tax=Micropruina sp. TaxID=2737536 RepID=UPI0039E382FC
MADENAANTGTFIDDLVAKAKGVGGQVREFTEDAFDRVREFSASAGDNIKNFATDAGGNIMGFATDAGDNLKNFSTSAGDNIKNLAAGAREKSQQAFDEFRGRIDGGTKKEQRPDDDAE